MRPVFGRFRFLIERPDSAQEPDEARREIRRLERTTAPAQGASLDVKLARKLNDLGAFYGVVGDAKRGAAALRRVVDDPANAQPETGRYKECSAKFLGNLCFTMGLLEARRRLRRAEPWLRRAVALNRKDDGALTALGALQVLGGRCDEALQSLRAAVKLNPENPEAHFNLAIVCERLNKQADAVKHYRAFVELTEDRGRYADERKAVVELLERGKW